MSGETIADLPAGYRILNDGPGREVLFREEWDEGEVWPTVAAAVARARYIEDLPPLSNQR